MQNFGNNKIPLENSKFLKKLFAFKNIHNEMNIMSIKQTITKNNVYVVKSRFPVQYLVVAISMCTIIQKKQQLKTCRCC